MASIAKDIVDSIFHPTTKPQAGVIKVMNAAFYGLFCTLVGLAYVTNWNVHVLALSGVAVALFASISWFIVELGKVQEQQELDKQQQRDGSPERRKTTTIDSGSSGRSSTAIGAEQTEEEASLQADGQAGSIENAGSSTAATSTPTLRPRKGRTQG